MKIVVYTANIDGYDKVYKPLFHGPNIDYVFFCNVPKLLTLASAYGWKSVSPAELRKSIDGFDPDFQDLNPRKKSRYLHEMACLWFRADYDVAIQHGANIQLNANPIQLVKKYLTKPKADVAVFKHPHRNTVKGEVAACAKMRKDDPALMARQYAHMLQEGFKDDVGLSACMFMIWQLNGRVARTQRMWWDEVKQWSMREQLSFDYVAWKTGLKISHIPGDPFKSPILRYNYHG